MKNLTSSTLVCGLVAALAMGSASHAVAGNGGKEKATDNAVKTLDANEETHLVFMREEEKLARDVYITLGALYPKAKIFGRIDDSEQRHTCAVCDMLKKYGVDDPNTNDNVGVYTGEAYGEYFTEKYRQLTERGSENLLAALHVGALVEEMDMEDINYCPKEILEQDNGINAKDQCGKIYTDNPDVRRLYTSLLEGSENHLRAFVRNIERIQGKGSYQAQYLEQDQVDQILGR